MNKLQEQDIKEFVKDFALLDELRDKTFLITGSTGLIGSTLCFCLIGLNERHGLGIKMLCPVRNMNKALALYGDNNNIILMQETLSDFLMQDDLNIDYIVHCASPTASKYMVSNPAETFSFAIESTTLLLQYASTHKIKSMVYVSSLEYYGQILNDEIITEDKIGYIDPKSPRSSYPLGKRAAEFACLAYCKEYGVPVKMARLTQTFGAGISRNDNRVFAQFARAAINNEDIILKSSGRSSKPYCYTTDSINGILTILLKGKDGEPYNVSNDDTYTSINDMAQLVKDNFNPKINIRHEIDPHSGYAPDTLLRLSSSKLQSLGWKPKYNLKEMYRQLINYIASC